MAQVLIAGEWELVRVEKVLRGRRTARVTSDTYGKRLDLPTCLFFGTEPDPLPLPGTAA
jgi:hypothetical protein